MDRRADGATVDWPTAGLSFGGDYNPEQWSPEVWRDDVRLMIEAKVTIVTLGVFSWAAIEPRNGEFEWGWLDEVIGLLHEAGIAVDLATPTAAPPSWLLTEHPEILPTERDMTRQEPGGRLGWCPSSPVFRRYALRVVNALVERYAAHPAVRLWHVSNELGGGNGRCFCDVSAAAFRLWLRRRYTDIAAVNAAWGAAFWGHTFADFDEITPPRGRKMSANPGHFLDYERFSSDELLDHYLAEAGAIRTRSTRPVTTNFMVGSGGHVVDYAAWSKHTDIVANDHYTIVDDENRAQELAFAADRMRGLTRDRSPWLLMEHSTGAPSWQERNRAKSPGEIRRNALAHVARGSDGAMFFQWRASTAGAEQFHSAMLPHAGEHTRVFAEVSSLGRTLDALADIRGGTVEPARVALLADEQSAWAFEQGLKPHRGLRYSREPRLWHSLFWNRQVLVDVLPADADIDGYDLVIVPSLYIVGEALATRIRSFVDGGGTVLVTYLSGIVDETNRIIGGGYPGALRDVVGVWTEEFRPLQQYQTVTLSDGGTVRDWTEDTVLAGADAVVGYTDGDAVGRAAVTRHSLGAGAAWYVGAALDPESAGRIVDRLIADLELPRVVDAAPGLEAVRRRTAGGDVLFLINHTEEPQTVSIGGGTAGSDSDVTVAPGDVAIIRERTGERV